jgi:hypothetical protein
MRAVSNTTPLWYLIAIELEHLLGQLFEKVLVPVAVHEKLTDSRTPETVRGRVLSMPAWFEVRTVQETETATFPVTLHRGERQAILVASTMPARRLKLPLPVELAPTYPFSSREMTSLPSDLGAAIADLLPAVAHRQIKPKTASALACLSQTLMKTIQLSQHEFIRTHPEPRQHRPGRSAKVPAKGAAHQPTQNQHLHKCIRTNGFNRDYVLDTD